MTDDWDEITQLLKKNSSPEASDTARKLAICKAMAAFEKKHSQSHQGISFVNRLIVTVKTVCKQTIGEFNMKKAYIVAGGVCVSFLAVALMNSTYLSTDLLPKGQGTTYQNEDKNMVDAIAVGKADKLEKTTQSSLKNYAVKDAEEQVVLNESVYMSPPESSKPISGERFKYRHAEADLKEKVAAKKVAGGDNLPVPSGAVSGASIADVASSPLASSTLYSPSPMMTSPSSEPMQQSYHEEGRDKFQDIKENPTKVVSEEPVSTFSVDVDTSSYSFMRASLNNNVLPQKDAVRIEEMVNYFPYDYEVPKDKSEPFKANVSVFPTPWNSDTKLMHIGIKGYQIEQKEKPHSNLVFLIDTSGSMDEQNKLPLLKNSMKLLLDGLQADDTVSIVTYAGSSGVALEPTKVSDKLKIITTLDNLSASGSTAGAQGIKTAYDLAESNFDKNGVNRVILATDGDFNVGITNQEELKGFIERKRDSGIFLSVLGFGRGNYNDALMQTLAQNGNGNAAYIDNLSEARKALVEEAGSTLFTIAKDVKIQVEFNPENVAEYRLIGYETRLLNREDFNNDKVDAGDIGSGHAVTAIYEITPVGSKARLIDESRYQKTESKEVEKRKDKSGEYAFVKIRYKLPDSDTSKLITTPVDSKVEYKKLSEVPVDAKFATSVAAFAQLLRGDSYTKSYKYDDVIELAQSAKG
ncbi:MAG: VWA domain-containing protein, partial [Rickettsiales bacterium]